ncbi:MAG: HDOD domain-containing protein [Propionivibrio sp.]|nr:HDOD domain-containing protein [Propionivibrio sp.]MBP7523589.1 HDOD domain-containing protein [Propionivibrio sp.]
MVFNTGLLDDLTSEEGNRVKRLMERGVTIPAQPRVLLELQEQLARGVSDVRLLARTIGQDPGIGAMLFKVTQGSTFRRLQPLASLEHVLQAIGLKQTANLVQAIALSTAVPAKHNQKAFEAYWARSRAVSELAMLIADERVAVCNIFPDQACLAGVFHDCGVPVLMQRFSSYCREMNLEGQGNWIDLKREDARFNADHCVIGYLVARHWKLPDFICDAIRFHHDMARINHHAARTMVAILQLAFHLYHHDQHLPSPEWPAVSHQVLDELGLGPDTLPELSDIVLERYHDVA